jgi:hypothetical protein
MMRLPSDVAALTRLERVRTRVRLAVRGSVGARLVCFVFHGYARDGLRLALLFRCHQQLQGKVFRRPQSKSISNDSFFLHHADQALRSAISASYNIFSNIARPENVGSSANPASKSSVNLSTRVLQTFQRRYSVGSAMCFLYGQRSAAMSRPMDLAKVIKAVHCFCAATSGVSMYNSDLEKSSAAAATTKRLAAEVGVRGIATPAKANDEGY